jgi:8-oxo-dGTP pyrophosphatase MutT (NUDIX family)
MDGRYDLPSGHVEQGEALLHAAVRELQEEAGITVGESGLKLWHINQFSANNENYYNFFFFVDEWDGEPRIMEPEKCDDMRFFAPDALPKMTAGTHVAVEHLGKPEVSFGFIDQARYDEIAA